MQETVELRAAIENLYAVFSTFPLREDTNACACCHKPGEERRLHEKPLRELRPQNLEQYAWDALFVWGSVDDFKHFLPRIFELAAAHGNEFADPPVVFNKLYHGEWHYWPETERRAVQEYLKALWNCVINSPPDEYHGEEIEDWLCGIAQAESDLLPYLNTWNGLSTENAVFNLASFIAETDFADPGRRATAFWEERGELLNQVAAWVRSEEVIARLRTLASECPDNAFVERAITALI